MTTRKTFERIHADRDDRIVFAFYTKAGGRKALRKFIDAISGKCGTITYLPLSAAKARTRNDRATGYVGCMFEGRRNALAPFTRPWWIHLIVDDLGISFDEYNAIVDDAIYHNHWYELPADTPG